MVQRRSTAHPPPEVLAAADARADARASRDWATADRLRGEIEAAGWKVVDTGLTFQLEPAHPPDVVAEGIARYGRSAAVPSRLDEPELAGATLVVVAREDPDGAARAVRGVLRTDPRGEVPFDVVLVADGLDADREAGLEAALGAAVEPTVLDEPAAPDAGDVIEIVRTSARLGHGASLNAGCRRARRGVVIVLDASVEPTGDLVGPLVAALDDPAVGVAGPFGLTSADLRHFEEMTSGPAAAIEGYVQAFRRLDYIKRGPFDEAFRFYRNLDVWWSLVLRDEGEGVAPRDASVVAGLPLRRHDHVAWSSTSPAERDRLSKRNFYRLLDQFRDRRDLAVPTAG